MLDKNRDIFFFHIPKTGGSSIEHAHGFGTEGEFSSPFRHINYRQLKSKCDSLPTSYFLVIRKHTDRIKSTYKHLFRTKLFTSTFDQQITWKDYSFDEYVNNIKKYFKGDLFVKGVFAYENCNSEIPLLDIRHIERIQWWTEGLDNRSKLYLLSFYSLRDDYINLLAPVTGIKDIPYENITPKEIESIPCDYTGNYEQEINSIYGGQLNALGAFSLRFTKKLDFDF